MRTHVHCFRRPCEVALLLLIMTAGPGPARAQAAREAPPAVAPSDTWIPGVANAARLSEALWRGAQPTTEGFAALERLGVRTVVNLRHDHDDLPLLAGTRLKYVRIPTRAYRPTQASVVAFLKVLEDPANWPVFVHCAQGRDRTGVHVAAYRIVNLGWTAEAALQEMRRFHVNRIWVGLPGFVRSLDPVACRAQIAAAPHPVFQLTAPR